MADRSELLRRLVAEFFGTAFLLAVVVGSGIAAQRLSPDNVGLQLLENSTATGLGLVALIIAFGPVSGAHFNPVVSLTDTLLGGLRRSEAALYTVSQTLGACAGTMLANLMFSLAAVNVSDHTRSSGGLWLSEIVATFGLLTVILGIVRTGRTTLAPFAVGAYIAAAYWFTSSTAFANPAATIGRTLTNTFAGIAPSSAPAFVVAEVTGALAALALAMYLHPGIDATAVVVPHEGTEATT